MSRMGDWLIEHEENVGGAIESGLESEADILAFCKTNMTHVDESTVRRLTGEYWNLI